MSAEAESVQVRREQLLASKQALLSQLAVCTDRLETLRTTQRKPILCWDSPDSDTELEMPRACVDVRRTRGEAAALRTRLLATQELTGLTVERSETMALAELPENIEPALPESVANAGGRAGAWRAVSTQCRVDSVPFEMSFLVHENSFGALAYRSVRVTPVKRRQAAELGALSCAAPAHAAGLLRRYAAACRARRETLLALADAYSEERLDIQPAEGAYRISCVDILKVEWRLQAAVSPLLPFRHRVLIELDYVTDDRYLAVIKKAHDQLKDSEISTAERTRVFCKLIDVCMIMYNEQNNITGATEFDAETVKIVTNSHRRLTLDHHNDDCEEEEQTGKKSVKERTDKSKTVREKIVKMPQNFRNGEENGERSVANKVKKKTGQGSSNNIQDKPQKKATMETLTEKVPKIQLIEKNNIQNVQRTVLDNECRVNDGRVDQEKLKNKKKQIKITKVIKTNKNVADKVNEKRSHHADNVLPKHVTGVTENNKIVSVLPQEEKIKNNEKLKKDQPKHKGNSERRELPDTNIICAAQFEEVIKEKNNEEASDKKTQEALKRPSKTKLKDKENLLLNISREIVTGITKHASKNAVQEKFSDRNAAQDKIANINIPIEKVATKTLSKSAAPEKSDLELIKQDRQEKVSEKNAVLPKLYKKTVEKVSQESAVQQKVLSKHIPQETISSNNKNMILEKPLIKNVVKENFLNKNGPQERISNMNGPQEKISKKNTDRELSELTKKNMVQGNISNKNPISEKQLHKIIPPQKISQKKGLQNKASVPQGKISTNHQKAANLEINHINVTKPKNPLTDIFNVPLSPIQKVPSKLNGIHSTDNPKTKTLDGENLKRFKTAPTHKITPKRPKLNPTKPNKIAETNPGTMKDLPKATTPKTNTEKPKTSTISKMSLERPKISQEPPKTIANGPVKRKIDSGLEKIQTKIPKKVPTLKSFSFGHRISSPRRSPRAMMKPTGLAGRLNFKVFKK